MFDLPTAHKMAGIRRFHARGNLLFAEGQFRRTAIQYKAALLWYEYTFPERQGGDDGQLSLDQRRVSCLSNLAACEISMREWEAAEATTGLALRVDPGNVKALYRRALARRHRHKFELAQADIEAAVALAPTDLALLRERALLRLTVREHHKVERATARRMMIAALPEAEPSDDCGSGASAEPLAVEPPVVAPAPAPDSAIGESLTAAAREHVPGGAKANDRSSGSMESVWTAGGDAVSGLTALEPGDDTSSVGGVSQWDGLGAEPLDDAGNDASSGFGLATDWATWAMQQDGGDEASEARPVRVTLAGAPAMSFDDLLLHATSASLASSASLRVLPKAGVL